jgi:hypothetical protein
VNILINNINPLTFLICSYGPSIINTRDNNTSVLSVLVNSF